MDCKEICMFCEEKQERKVLNCEFHGVCKNHSEEPKSKNTCIHCDYLVSNCLKCDFCYKENQILKKLKCEHLLCSNCLSEDCRLCDVLQFEFVDSAENDKENSRFDELLMSCAGKNQEISFVVSESFFSNSFEESFELKDRSNDLVSELEGVQSGFKDSGIEEVVSREMRKNRLKENETKEFNFILVVLVMTFLVPFKAISMAFGGCKKKATCSR